MSFFQNLFDDYEGCWTVGELKGYTMTFKVPANKNKGEVHLAWNYEPYDLSSDSILKFNFAFDRDFKNFSSFEIDVAGAVPSATKASEIRDILNASAIFSDRFIAGVDNNRLYVRQKRPVINFRTYISNSGAELALKFNKFAGIADIPSYFEKDTIENRFQTTEAMGRLIRLSHPIVSNTVADPTVISSPNHGLQNGDIIYIVGSNSTPTIDGEREVTRINDDSFSVEVEVTVAGFNGEWLNENEYQILTDAGIEYSNMLLDWQHLRGRTSSYLFTKNVVDGSERITSQLVWPAGARVGHIAKKIIYTYDADNTTATTKLEIPYVLTASDLVSP